MRTVARSRTTAEGVADPQRLSAALGLGLERVLRRRAPIDVGMADPWDACWVALRSAGRVCPSLIDSSACAECSAAVRAELARPMPEHPGHDLRCGCFDRWATAMRTPTVRGRGWALPQRLTTALIKPGAPRGPIRARLRRRFRIVHESELLLTPGHCERLYPDAHGADQVADLTAYLTSGPSQVLVLLGGDDAVAAGIEIRRAVWASLAVDRLQNHLYMPDTPADALADIGRLAGFDTLDALYTRWESHNDRHFRARTEAYRARLGWPGPFAGADFPWR